MCQKKKQHADLVVVLEQDHRETLNNSDRFYDLLIKIRYEGKAALGKNIKEAGEVLKFFRHELCEHMELEDEILFPFLKTHVPKLEPVIHLLQAEHEDFKRNLRSFEHAIDELAKERSDSDRIAALDKIREVGSYLIYLIRAHNHSENESVYKVMTRELHQDEKEELVEQVGKFRRK